jgi:arsenite methyltransferase
MSATGIPVDVDVLRSEIRRTYTDVSTEQEQEFIFPTGRAWAQELGYPEPELSRVPDATVESFAGVANHWSLGRVEPGEVVLDLGCGAGTDLLVAAQMTGPAGRVVGVDMTAAMLERAAASALRMGLTNVELHESLIEALPLDDGSVDVVISNGVIDLVPDKDAVLDEIDRVLRPGGWLQLADVVMHEEVSEDARARMDRLNRRRVAPGRARAPAGAAGVHGHHAGRAGRHLCAVGVRGHAPQGGQVRRDGLDDQGDEAALSWRVGAVDLGVTLRPLHDPRHR